MAEMFQGATVFNQNLCSFGTNWSRDLNVNDIFTATACPDTSDPTSASGPWCHRLSGQCVV